MLEPARRERTALAVALLCALLFLCLGLLFIPYAGIQNDEALISSGLYRPFALEHYMWVFGYMVPTMLMSYLGATKILLYKAIFAVWAPSVWSLRVPMVLVGAATIVLCYLLLRRLAGRRVALAAALLLATDTTYLLTTTFDWGPVALQHLLLLAGLWALVRFHDSHRTRWLAAAFFCFGLAMWDKALFSWIAGGLGVALLAVIPRTVLRHLTVRNVMIALVAFLAGAGPLLRYNGARQFATFSKNTHISSEDSRKNAHMIRVCLEGSSLFGYLTSDRPAPKPGQPSGVLEQVSFAVHRATGDHAFGLGWFAAIAAAALIPFAGRTRRLCFFVLVFAGVAWLQMGFTQGAGGGAHHTVLLWPLPQALIAAVAVGLAERYGRRAVYAAASAVLLVALSNALVLNQHLLNLVRVGPGTYWTEAIFPLSQHLEQSRGHTVYVMDWGILDALRLTGRGSLNLAVGFDPFLDADVTPLDLTTARTMFADHRAVYVSHTPGQVVFADSVARFEAALKQEHRRKVVERVIKDAWERPVFEIFRVMPEAAPSLSSEARGPAPPKT